MNPILKYVPTIADIVNSGNVPQEYVSFDTIADYLKVTTDYHRDYTVGVGHRFAWKLPLGFGVAMMGYVKSHTPQDGENKGSVKFNHLRVCIGDAPLILRAVPGTFELVWQPILGLDKHGGLVLGDKFNYDR